MSLPVLRRFAPGLLLFVLALSLPGRLAADLVWTPENGWKIEGGLLAGLNGADSRNALESMNKARISEEKGNAGSAAKAYEKVAKKYTNSIYAPEALYRAAKLRLTQKKYYKAFDDCPAVISRYPNTTRFNDIIGEQYRIASALLDGARGRIFGILPGFTNREKAIEYFEIILFNAPYSDYAPLALMNIARGHQRMKNTEEAIDALDRLINNYPQSLLAADAYLKLGQTHASLVEGPYYDQASTKEAVTYFEDFMIQYPGDNNVGSAEKGLSEMKRVLAESKMKMADFYFYKRDNFKAARVFYNEAITVYPDSEVAAKAKVRLAEVEAEAGKQVPADNKPGAAPAKKKKRFLIF